MHNDVDALYGVDLEGNVAMEIDGHNNKSEDEKKAEDQEQKIENNEGEEQEENENEDDAKVPRTSGQRDMVNSAAIHIYTVTDDQPIMVAEQGQEMHTHTPWPQPPASAPRLQTPKPLTQPQSPETDHLSGLQVLWLVMLQKPHPAIPTLHEAEVAGNTTDDDPGHQLLSESAGGNSLLTVLLSNVTLHEVYLYCWVGKVWYRPRVGEEARIVTLWLELGSCLVSFLCCTLFLSRAE